MVLIYKYTPLSIARSTRVIEVLPARVTSAAVVIQIHEIQLDHLDIPYEAVSYTWDGQIPDEPIECHRKRLYVTKNANDILRRLRRPRRARFIWIDAICIDQTCDQDKYSQIVLMADIYRKATQVVVWLGDVAPALTKRHQAIQHRRESSSFLNSLWNRGRLLASYVVPTYSPSITPIHHSRESLKHRHDMVSVALRQVLHHSYWQRAWTAQEFSLNRNCSLQFSHGQISKEEFRALLHLRKDTGQPFRLVHLATWFTENGRSSSIPHSSIDNGFDEICSIFECLPYLRSYLPVDRVFALVSVYPHLLGNVTINYRCEPAKVYTEAAMCMIQNTGHLSILSFAGSDRGGEVVGLASWVPDWTMTRAPLPACGRWLRHLYRRRLLADSMPLSFDSRGAKLRATRRPARGGKGGLRADGSDCPEPIFDLTRAMSEGILCVKGVFVADVSDEVSDVMADTRRIFLHSLAAFLYACTTKFGSASLKSELISCMEYFEKYFEDYVKWYQPSVESREEDSDMEMPVPLQESEPAALRTWVETCVDELAMDPQMTKCMQENHIGFMVEHMQQSPDLNNVMRHGSEWESRRDGNFDITKDTESKFREISTGQRLFMTANGTLGMSERVEQGDRVVLIAGCDKPFIIRQDSDVQSFERYRLVGEAYLNGVQDGQKWPTDDRETTDIFLV